MEHKTKAEFVYQLISVISVKSIWIHMEIILKWLFIIAVLKGKRFSPVP